MPILGRRVLTLGTRAFAFLLVMVTLATGRPLASEWARGARIDADFAPALHADPAIEPSPELLEKSIQALVAPVVAATVRIETEDGLGSGTIVSAGGAILTSAHVIEGCRSIRVTLADKRRFTAKIVGINTAADLALLSIPIPNHGKKLDPAPLGDSDRIRTADWVVAAGHPTTAFADCQPTLSLGNVRQIDGAIKTDHKEKVFINTIVTDAPISAGSSGGGLFDLEGRLIGVNAAVTQDESRGYAVRISEFVEDKVRLEAGERFARAPRQREVEERSGRRTRTVSEYFDKCCGSLKTFVGGRIAAIMGPSGMVRGVICSKDGDVLSVAEPFEATPEGAEFTADLWFDFPKQAKRTTVKLRAIDRTNGVALLRLAAESGPVESFDLALPADVRRGSIALALARDQLKGGIVGALKRVPPLDLTREVYYPDVTQVDLRLSSASIGNAVIDRSGRLIGMVVQHRLMSSEDRFRGGPYGAFVLPTAVLAESLLAMKDGASRGERACGFMGVQLEDMTPEQKERHGVDDGLLVGSRMWVGGPAYESGIRPGDVVLSVGGMDAVSRAQTVLHILSFKRGERVPVIVKRGQKTISLDVTVADRADLATVQMARVAPAEASDGE